MIFKEKEVLLPTDTASLDAFIGQLMIDFKLPASDDTYEAIALQIMHLDNRMGRVKRSFFADCAIKFLANKAAYERLEQFANIRKQEAANAKAKADAEKAASGVSDVPKQPVQDA